MKNLFATLSILLVLPAFGGTKNARTPSSVSDPAIALAQAVESIHLNDIKTVVTKVKTQTPCADAGSYDIEMFVKVTQQQGDMGTISDVWQSVKHVNVGKDGSIMKICAE